MQNKKELLEIVFSKRPLWREILQDKENGMSQAQLGKKYAARDANVDCIKKIRKELIQLFDVKGGWKELCHEAVQYGFIIEKPKPDYAMNHTPCNYLIETVAMLQAKEENKKWKAKKKLLGWK
ncbi:MAG: hypothetical protein HY063_14325 [Bacteroidetes bacterium]|nr:hypothetical protein [Bacteroidota bacterium]